jgi:hypothetical protein
VICYHCGVILYKWQKHDSPWESHAQAEPTCPHVLLKKGREFVRRVTHRGYSMWYAQKVRRP